MEARKCTTGGEVSAVLADSRNEDRTSIEEKEPPMKSGKTTYKTHYDAYVQLPYSHAYYCFEGLNQWLARSERDRTSRPSSAPTDRSEAGNVQR
jgi:hypothetical protein